METTQPASYGTCSFTPDADSEGFVAFEDLTEADVLEWVYEALDKDAVEAVFSKSDRGSEGSCDDGWYAVDPSCMRYPAVVHKVKDDRRCNRLADVVRYRH
jgi:hypothetical protein